MRRALMVLLAAGAFSGGALAAAHSDDPSPGTAVHACVSRQHQLFVYPDGACRPDETPLDFNQSPISAGGRAQVLSALATVEASAAAQGQSARLLQQAVDALDTNPSLDGFGKEQKRQLRKWMKQVRRVARKTSASAAAAAAISKHFHDTAKSIIANIRA
jgi:hypothetical protein